MSRVLVFLIALLGVPLAVRAAGDALIRCPSPNGRFALRIGGPTSDDSSDRDVDLIEKRSGKVVADLGTTPVNYVPHTVLVWSADGKRVAYGTRGDREGEVGVYFWNGSTFDEVTLPDPLPDPDIKFGKSTGAVKNYGGAANPVRWLKSGELLLTGDLMMLSRDNGWTYTGTVQFTIAFDAHHHASVHHVGKTRTVVDK